MTPDFIILANGQDITAQIKDRLLSLRLTDDAGFKTDAVEIVLDDRDGVIALPKTGAELDVALGYQESGIVRMGLYTVDEVELSSAPAKMTIRAKAAAFIGSDKYDSLQDQKSRSWDNKTLGEIVDTIASEHGYESVVGKDFAKIVLPHVEQKAESDLNLLVRLAKNNSAVIKVMASRICCVREGAAERENGESMPELTINPADVINWRASLTDRNRFNSIKARWHDKDEARTLFLLVGEGKPVYEITHIHADKKAAEEAAESYLSQFQRSSSTVNLTIIGNVNVSAESKLSIQGFRQGVDGQWVCRRVEHTLSSSGLTTSVDAEEFRAKQSA